MLWVKTVLLLTLSNLFMTYAWYGHLKDLKAQPLVAAVFFSWGVAFFEYCLQVPANRIGSVVMTLPQLKILQEVLALTVFAVFYLGYWKGNLTWHYGAAAVCMVGAVAFVFRAPSALP